MLAKILVALTASVLLASEYVHSATDKIVCYHGTWANYRPGNGQFKIENIDPTLCTHFIYTFVGLEEWSGSVKLLDSWLDIDLEGFKRFNSLRDYSGAKTLVAIGGWNEGSEKYSKVVGDPALRANFIRTATDLVLEHGFDGFDLDWEYPAQRGGDDFDKSNFATLLREFREEFDKHGLLLTAAVGATGAAADLSYDVPSLSKYLSWINVMTYDFHGSWDDVTGHNAPLYPSSIETTEAQRKLNVNESIHDWIARGADPQKLVLGMGTYGRSFTLSTSIATLGAPVAGAGAAGPYTREAGMLGYNEVCENLKGGDWSVVWDDEQKVPFAFRGNQWVGYDSPDSIKIKVDFAKSLNLGGTMIWSVETDDFLGLCGDRYPLLRAINEALGRTPTTTAPLPSTTPPATASPTSGTPTPTPTPSGPGPEPSGECSQTGYIRDPENCGIFYYCQPYNDGYIQYQYNCPDGLFFDSIQKYCGYPETIDC